MNLKKFVPTLLVAAAAAVGGSAQAAFVVLDGWQLQTPVGLTTDIGRLNLVSGNASVEQEINGMGNAFVGARFRESGQIFSISYTEENTPGGGDSGPPGIIPGGLKIEFTNVGGQVTELFNGGADGFEYVFTSGNFSVSDFGDTTVYATGNIIGIGGTTGATQVISGVNGDSTLLAQILNAIPAFDIRDSMGNSLLAEMAAGNVLFEAVTNNNVTNVTNPGAACSFDAGANCRTFNVASAGDAYIVQLVSAPGTLALAGLGLIGVAAMQRRKAKKA